MARVEQADNSPELSSLTTGVNQPFNKINELMTDLTISKLDYQRIRQRMEAIRATTKTPPTQLINLLRTITGTNLVEPVQMPANIVTMNSLITVDYIDSGKTLNLRLVYPEEANSATNRISIFAPLASALLGRGQGELVQLPTPFGSVKVRINQVLYQPEAAGDFSL